MRGIRRSFAVCVSVFLAALLSATTLRAQLPDGQRAPAPIVLKASGLPNEEAPEAVLPLGAVLHVRLKSAELLLDNASAMAEKFVPQAVLPPPLQQAMQQPNAMLGLIGMNTVGAPLSVDQLSQRTGIDPTRAISLTFYVGFGPPDQAFVLTIPVRDMTTFSALLSGASAGAPHEVIPLLNGGSAVHVRIKGKDLLLVCSEKTVCISGSSVLASALIGLPREKRLDHASLVGKVLRQHPGDNLVVLLDAEPLKALLPMLQRFSKIPDQAVLQLRQQLLARIPPRNLAALNRQLRMRLGMRDVDQALDYVECVATGAYEVLAENLLADADQFEGLSLAVNLSANYQRVHFSVYSRGIKAAEAARPLPLADMARTLAQVPGTHNALELSGQTPAAAKSKLLGDILARIDEKLKQKELRTDFCDVMRKAYADYQPVQQLDSQVPWTIRTQAPIPSNQGPRDIESLQAYFASLGDRLDDARVTVIPRQQKGFLDTFFQEQAHVSTANDGITRRLMKSFGSGPPSYAWEARASSTALPGGVTRFTQESRYTTHWGLFGYDEHELINRKFTLARDVGDVTLLWRGGRDPALLARLVPQPTPVAVRRILSEMHVPAGANHIEVLRVLQSLNGLADALTELEGVVHKEIDDYLAQVDAVRKQGGKPNEMMARLVELKIPPEVFQLKINEQNEFYVTTPVGLTFPRPKLMPEVQVLLSDFRKASDSQGGAAVCERTRDGEYELIAVQSTEALATLVRSVGENFALRYLRDPAGMATLHGLLRTPLDEASARHRAILVNTMWEFLAPSPMQQIRED